MSQQSFQSVEYVGGSTSPTDLDSDNDRQSLGSAPHLSAKYATQLSRFHLRLIDQPQLLVCTLPDCTAGLPLVPSFAKITAHLKEFHSHAVLSSAGQALREVLDELDLDPPSTVQFGKLPVPTIKELKVVYNGYQCNLCSYSIVARSSLTAHFKKEVLLEVSSQ